MIIREIHVERVETNHKVGTENVPVRGPTYTVVKIYVGLYYNAANESPGMRKRTRQGLYGTRTGGKL